jgi:23S rRNA (uracil1939-C5)-methyltransferase
VRLEVRIEEIGARGDGLARDAQGPIYVAGAAPGDRALVEITGGRGEGRTARIVELLEAGADRAAPPCAHFGACGGCALQHLSTALTAECKREQEVRALRRRGFAEPPIRETVATPPASRRRARFAARRLRQSVALGFNERAGARIVDLAECHVLRPALVALLAPLRGFLMSALRPGEIADVQATETETGLDLWLEGPREPSRAAREESVRFAEQHDLARLAWNDEVVVRRRAPIVTFGGVAVEPPPGAFLQASREGERALTDLVLAGAGDAKRALDLFCGVGTFALPLAAHARVAAFDGDAAMVAALNQAARAAGRPLAAERRDLFRRPLQGDELEGVDAAVFDPPRAGASAQAGALARSGIPTIVAVSCDPATFARDARILAEGGYALESVTPVDQFVWSPHVELAAVFRRQPPL